MDYKEMLAQANKLFEEAKAILNNPKATAEETARVCVVDKDGVHDAQSSQRQRRSR